MAPPSGSPWAPAVRMGREHSWGAAELIVMSWYVAVNTLFTLLAPPPRGSQEAIFRISGRYSRPADRIFGIGPIGPYHLAIGQPLF